MKKGCFDLIGSSSTSRTPNSSAREFSAPWAALRRQHARLGASRPPTRFLATARALYENAGYERSPGFATFTTEATTIHYSKYLA